MTMKRLAATQLWPVFASRPNAAVATVLSMFTILLVYLRRAGQGARFG
jgi:hypothetical protein